MRTLRSLADAAHGIARGRLSERVPVRGRDEFASLGSAFNDMANQLQARLAELQDERGRLRGAITRFGEALAATHDVGTLLRVIVEAAVEATGATGARLVADDGRLVESGDPDAEGERLELPLTAGRTTFGKLTLVGETFDDEQRMTADRSRPMQRSRSRMRGCTGSSSARRSSTGLPASPTGASAKRRSPPRSRAPNASAHR